MTRGPGVDIDTGEAGAAYFEEKLAPGWLLTPLVLGRIRSQPGRVITRAFGLADLPSNFNEGLDPDVSKLQWQLAIETTLTLLSHSDDAVALFEHPFATPVDRWLSVKPLPYLTCENSVLFTVNARSARPDRVELVLGEAGAQDELGVVGRQKVLSELSSGPVERGAVEELVATADLIILRAFDAEGYFLWLPKPSTDI